MSTSTCRLPLADIGPLLARLAEEPPATGVEAPAGLPTEVAFATLEGDMSDMPALGRPSAFTCPACRGALWELRDGEILRYRCHVGHAYSPETLQAAQEEDTEQALYAAVRSLQEQAATMRRIAQIYAERHPELRTRNEARAAELERSAVILRGMLARGVQG